jgi:hypothetical protein
LLAIHPMSNELGFPRAPSFMLLGLALGLAVQASQSTAWASGCDSQGYVGGDLVGVRRVESESDPGTQSFWGDDLDIYAISEDAATGATFDRASPAAPVAFALRRVER